MLSLDPMQVDGQGLFDCLESSLHRLGIQAVDSEQCKMLIGIGTDGESANIAAAGLKGLVERRLLGYIGVGAWLIKLNWL